MTSENSDNIPPASPPRVAEDPENRRSEPRFDVSLRGSARPLMSAHGTGERTYPITIVDVSRTGMRFLVDSTAPLYPLAEVSFAGPSGRIRNVLIKLLRIRLVFRKGLDAQTRQTCEVAARAIDDSEMAQIQARQRRVQEIDNVLRRREGLPVLVVGDGRPVSAARSALASAGWPVTVTNRIARVEEMLAPKDPQALVYLDGKAALMQREMIGRLRRERPLLAQVAVVHSADDRQALLAAGIDECVHTVNAEPLLEMYLHRAIKACLLRSPGSHESRGTHLLMLVENNLRLAQLGMASHREAFRVTFSYDRAGMMGLLRFSEVDALILDDDSASARDWVLLRHLRLELPLMPVIVAVTELPRGAEALAHGATEYLPLPATKQDLQAVVASSQRIIEFEAGAQARTA